MSHRLRQGANAVGAMLGNGFFNIPRERYSKFAGSYGAPKMIFKLQIEYEDGTRQTVVSDDSWKAAPGPVTFSSIYGGEDYDAGLAQAGWTSPDFDDARSARRRSRSASGFRPSANIATRKATTCTIWGRTPRASSA